GAGRLELLGGRQLGLELSSGRFKPSPEVRPGPSGRVNLSVYNVVDGYGRNRERVSGTEHEPLWMGAAVLVRAVDVRYDVWNPADRVSRNVAADIHTTHRVATHVVAVGLRLPRKRRARERCREGKAHQRRKPSENQLVFHVRHLQAG